MSTPRIARAMVPFAAALFAMAQPAQAQLKPLDVEHDFNGVDVLSGKIQTRPPEISVPGAGHLQFQKIQDLQPIMSGTITAGSPDGAASYDLNNGTLSSEHFDCDDNIGCQSKKKNGSALEALPASKRFTYMQGGTATQIVYDLQNFSQGPLVAGTGFSFYPSTITYANGEQLIFTYETYTGTNGDKYRRPNAITSNLGYRLAFAYQAPWEQPGWTTIVQATMYGPGDVIVGQLTYSGNSVTDLAGRVFTCTNCGNSLGSQSTTSSTSLRLPGESVDTLAATGANCLSTGVQYISDVTSDGVSYNYAFTPTSSTCQYLQKAVITGPLSFSRTVNITAGFNVRPRITSIVDSLGRTTGYLYDNALRVTSITYPEGNSVNVVYDLFGNITESRLIAKTGSGLADIVETALYDAPQGCEGVLCYKPVWTRDAKSQQTDYTWSGAHGGLLTKLEHADASGNRRKTINEYLIVQGAPTRLLRERICAANSAGVEQTCGTSSEVVREFSYWGATSLPLTETVKDGTGGQARTTTFAYDGAGRLLSTDGPAAGTDDATYNRYDVAGRRTWEIGSKGANGYRTATKTTYRDADDQPLTIEKGYVIDATDTLMTVLNTQHLTYDTRRKLTKTRTEASGTDLTVTQMSYDARNRDLCAAIRMNPATWAALPADACTLGTAGTQGADRITRTSYDAESRVTLIEKAVGTAREQDYVTYTYTVNGKKEFITDANGNKAKFQYDGHDRQTHWWFPSKTSAGTVSTSDYEQYGYDANGNRTSLRKRDGRTLTFTYDAMNRMIAKVVPDGCAPIQVGSCTPSTATRDVFYNYDVQGRQLTAKFDSAAGVDGLTSVYDLFGRLASSTINMGGFSETLAAEYDESGNRTRLTHPDGNYFTYAYDPADRMTGALENGLTSLVGFAYRPTGERASMSLSVASTSYGYDGISRLTSLSHDIAATSSDVAWTFGYNPASQLSAQSRDNDAYAWTGHVETDRAYAINGLNQYATAGPATFTYDANGNLTSDGVTSYIYDAENRLVSATATGQTTTLSYDPMGRLWQVVGTGTNTRFLYDGDELVAEYDASGALLRRYVHGAAVDDPMIWYEGATLDASGRRQLFADRQGSVIGIADAAGISIAVNSYDEYGIPATSTSGLKITGRFGYTGQAWIPELGMYHYKARLYSPTLGRFLQTDPIGYDDQINLYAYVANDPVNKADPDGKQLQQKNPKDTEVVNRVNMFLRTGKPQTISLDKKTTVTISKNGQNVSFTLRHKVGFVTAKVSGTGTLTVKQGSVTLNNMKLKSETLGVSVTHAPTQMTIRNENNGRIGVHTNAGISARGPFGSKINQGPIHQIVNSPSDDD